MKIDKKVILTLISSATVFSLQRTIYDFVISIKCVEEKPFFGILIALCIYIFLIFLVYMLFALFNKIVLEKFDEQKIENEIKENFEMYKKYYKCLDSIEYFHKKINCLYEIFLNLSKIFENDNISEYDYKLFNNKRVDIALMIEIYDICKKDWDMLMQIKNLDKEKEFKRLNLNKIVVTLNSKVNAIKVDRNKLHKNIETDEKNDK